MNVVMESYLDKQTPKLCLDFQTLITVWRTVSVQRWHECQSKFDWFSMTTDKSLSCSHWVIYRQELCVFVFCLIVCVGFFFGCVFITLYLILHLGWEMNQLVIWVDACWRNQFRWSTKPNLYQFLINGWLFCKNHENPVTANIGIHHSGKDEGPFMKIIVHTCRLYNPMYCRQN